MGCSVYQRQECTHTHAQHNTQKPFSHWWNLQRIKERKGGERHSMCVYTRDTEWSSTDPLHWRHRLWQDKNTAEVCWERNTEEREDQSPPHTSHPPTLCPEINPTPSQNKPPQLSHFKTFLPFWQSAWNNRLTHRHFLSSTERSLPDKHNKVWIIVGRAEKCQKDDLEP